jgi:hypothetical protein
MIFFYITSKHSQQNLKYINRIASNKKSFCTAKEAINKTSNLQNREKHLQTICYGCGFSLTPTPRFIDGKLSAQCDNVGGNGNFKRWDLEGRWCTLRGLM